jgi:hypothetical protein
MDQATFEMLATFEDNSDNVRWVDKATERHPAIAMVEDDGDNVGVKNETTGCE